MFDLANIFQFIDNSLNDSAFAEQDFIRHMHQTVFHVLSQFGYQMDPVNEELFEKGFGNISFVTKQLTVDPREQISPGKGLSVICVSGGEYKIKNLTFVIDDEMKLKPEKPSNTAMALCGQALHYFVRMLPLEVTGSQRGRVNEGYACTVAQASGFKKNN